MPLALTRKPALTTAVLAGTMLLGSVTADSYREQGRHVHGAAQLNLLIAGAEVLIEFNSPAANLFGFEHRPRSPAQRAEIERTVASLEDGASLFVFEPDAGCTPDGAEIEVPWSDAGHVGHEHEVDGHGSEDHEHQASARGGDDHGHGAHSGEHAAHEGGAAEHRDLHAVYRFDCTAPQAHRTLEVRLLAAFPRIERLRVQYIIEDRQGAVVLSPDQPTLRW